MTWLNLYILTYDALNPTIKNHPTITWWNPTMKYQCTDLLNNIISYLLSCRMRNRLLGDSDVYVIRYIVSYSLTRHISQMTVLHLCWSASMEAHSALLPDSFRFFSLFFSAKGFPRAVWFGIEGRTAAFGDRLELRQLLNSSLILIFSISAKKVLPRAG